MRASLSRACTSCVRAAQFHGHDCSRSNSRIVLNKRQRSTEAAILPLLHSTEQDAGWGNLATRTSLLEPQSFSTGVQSRHFSNAAASNRIRDTVHQKIKGRRRFYKDVSVKNSADAQWEILLDKRVLKTPGRRPLVFATESLARAVAAEWDAQTGPKGIEPATMPLMTLSATAIDQVAPDPHITIDNIMKYLPTDTVCFLAPEEERIIRKRQQELWIPLHSWFHESFGHELGYSDDGIRLPVHPPNLVSTVRKYVESLEPTALSALQCLVMECKSVVIALAVAHRHITIEQAFDAARLEECFNIENWGLVEGGHDLDISSTQLMLSAASTLLWLGGTPHQQLQIPPRTS